MRMRVLLVLLVICVSIRQIWSISFHLDPDSRKCIREEVHKDVLVVGDYEVEELPSQKTNIEVSHMISRDVLSVTFHRLLILKGILYFVKKIFLKENLHLQQKIMKYLMFVF